MAKRNSEFTSQSTLKPKKNSSLEKFFNYTIIRFSLENKIPSSLVHGLIYSHFIISGVIMLDTTYRYKTTEGNAVSIISEKGRSLDSVKFACWFYYILMSVVNLTCFLLIHTLSSKSISYVISCYMTIVYTYVVHPLMIWATAISLILETPSKPQGAEIVYLLLKIILMVDCHLTILIRFIFRNTMPTKFALATLNRSGEILWFLSYSINICLMMASTKGDKGSRLNPTFTSFLSNFLLATSTLFMLFRPPFWNKITSVNFVSLISTLTLTKCLVDFMSHQSASRDLLASLLVHSVVRKLTETLLSYTYRSNPFEANKGPLEIFEGFIFIKRHMNKEQTTVTMSTTEKSDYVHSLGLFASKVSIDSVPLKMSSIHELLVDKFQKMSRSNVYLFDFQLLVEMCKKYPNISKVARWLEMVKSKNNRTILAKFDAYHFRKLFECKLYQIYRGKMRDEDYDNSNISDIYDDFDLEFEGKETNLDLANSYQPGHQRLDIKRVLDELHMYNEIVSTVSKEVQTKSELFSSVLGSQKAKGKQVFELNKKIRSFGEDVKKGMEKIELLDKNHASYIYPIFIYYYSVVRNCIKLSDQIMERYKRRLTAILLSRSNRKRYWDMCEEDPCTYATDVSSLVMQVDMREDRLGEVSYSTPNYAQVLGYPSDLIVIGKNINELMPRGFCEHHKTLMKDYEKFGSKIFGHPKRELFITGFDGYLKLVEGHIKISPSMINDASALVLLSSNRKTRYSFFLVDSEGEIVAGERKFWDYFDHIPSKSDLAKIEQINQYMMECINLLDYFQLYKKTENTGDQIKTANVNFQSMHDSIGELLEELDYANTAGKIKFLVNRASIFYPALINNKIRFRYETVNNFGKLLFKVYLRLVGREGIEEAVEDELIVDIKSDEQSSEAEGSSNERSMSDSRDMSRSPIQRIGDTNKRVEFQGEVSYEYIIERCKALIEKYLTQNFNMLQSVDSRRYFSDTSISGKSQGTFANILDVIYYSKAHTNIMMKTGQPFRSLLGILSNQPGGELQINGSVVQRPALPYTMDFFSSKTIFTPVSLVKAGCQSQVSVTTLKSHLENVQKQRVFHTINKPLLQRRDLNKAQQEYFKFKDNTVLASTSMIHKILNRVMVDSTFT